MNLSRIKRLVKLLGLLQGGRRYNARDLAEICGVSRRTTFRDLEALREAGVPLVYEENPPRYHIPGAYFLPPTNFTTEEALAVIILCHELGHGDHLPFYSSAHAAAVKLENALPRRLVDYLRSVADSVRIKLPTTNPLTNRQDVYQRLASSRIQWFLLPCRPLRQ